MYNRQLDQVSIWDLAMNLEVAQYTQVLSPNAPVSPCCPGAAPDDIKISCFALCHAHVYVHTYMGYRIISLVFRILLSMYYKVLCL